MWVCHCPPKMFHVALLCTRKDLFNEHVRIGKLTVAPFLWGASSFPRSNRRNMQALGRTKQQGPTAMAHWGCSTIWPCRPAARRFASVKNVNKGIISTDISSCC